MVTLRWSVVEDSVEPLDDVVFGVADADTESHAALDLVRAPYDELVKRPGPGACLAEIGGKMSRAASAIRAEGGDGLPGERICLQKRSDLEVVRPWMKMI